MSTIHGGHYQHTLSHVRAGKPDGYFRSDSWEDLPMNARQACLKIGEEFWGPILGQESIKTVIACGMDAARVAQRWMSASETLVIDSGWGSMKCRLYTNDLGQALVQVPHFGRFAYFGAPHRNQAFLSLVQKQRTL